MNSLERELRTYILVQLPELSGECPIYCHFGPDNENIEHFIQVNATGAFPASTDYDKGFIENATVEIISKDKSSNEQAENRAIDVHYLLKSMINVHLGTYKVLGCFDMGRPAGIEKGFFSCNYRLKIILADGIDYPSYCPPQWGIGERGISGEPGIAGAEGPRGLSGEPGAGGTQTLDDVCDLGNITDQSISIGSGLTINKDALDADAVITFNKPGSGYETIRWDKTADQFELSDDLYVDGSGTFEQGLNIVPQGGDGYIFFNAGSKYFGWDDAIDRFIINDDLKFIVGVGAQATISSEGGISFEATNNGYFHFNSSANSSMYFDAGAYFDWRDRDAGKALRMRLTTTDGDLWIDGAFKANGDIYLDDNKKLIFGTDEDSDFYFDGTNLIAYADKVGATKRFYARVKGSDAVVSTFVCHNEDTGYGAGSGFLFAAGAATAWVGGVAGARIDAATNSRLSFSVLSNGSLTAVDSNAVFYLEGSASGAKVVANAPVYTNDEFYADSANGKGLIVKDKTTGTLYRIIVDNGAVTCEAV